MSMREQAQKKASGEEAGQIDLTPMLDVVFIMLIFFIVTSSFVKEPGVELFKPQASTTEACERGTIIFAVDDRGDIYYNKKKSPWSAPSA
jgi:biopolymer transport protein ExbD